MDKNQFIMFASVILMASRSDRSIDSIDWTSKLAEADAAISGAETLWLQLEKAGYTPQQ